ncbi:MAG: hypothetical protein HYT87_02870 [Nitrospirae bacterium]|nr:hypothetical protein [Nitrospirota bacterium]
MELDGGARIALAVLGVLCGMFGEIVFTAVADFISPSFIKSWNAHARGSITQEAPAWREKRDRRLTGYTFLWMIPVYATGTLLYAPVHNAMDSWPTLVRVVITASYFYALEFGFGLLFKGLLGRCPWDYSYSRWSFLGVIRWDYAPSWLALAFGIDHFWPKILQAARVLSPILWP